MQATSATAGNGASTHQANTHQPSSSSSPNSSTPVLRTAAPQQALWQAVHDGDTTAARELLAACSIDIHAIDPASRLTPLMLAASQEEEVVAQALIRAEPGAELNLRNNRGDSALSLAASGGKTDVVEMLLDRKAEIAQCGHDGRGALVEAVAGGHADTASLPAAMSDSTVMDDPKVEDLAAQVVNGELHLGRQETESLMKALAALLASPRCQVHQLVLNESALDAAGAALLSDALKVNRTLTVLALRFNQIGDAGAALLSDALKVNCRLTVLGLNLNQIGAAGAASLSQALKVNRTLTKLDLYYNQIGDAGAASLSEALKVNSTLIALHLGDNEIGDGGAASLSEALKRNRMLTKLDLGYSPIGDAGIASLSEALKVNRTLNVLNLFQTLMGDAGAALLSEALKVNRMLTALELGCNQIDHRLCAAIQSNLESNRERKETT